MGEETKDPTIRFYSRTQRKSGTISLQVVIRYKGKELRLSNVFTPKMTPQEYELFKTDGTLKNPLPETTLTKKEIEKATATMRNNRAFWIAATLTIDVPDERYYTSWKYTTVEEFSRFIVSELSAIKRLQKTILENGGLEG